jgi:CelD/BcsL family acetyltransferase involved in cellulose biosynthesis
MLTVDAQAHELRDAGELQAWAPLWQRLLAATPRPTFFQSLAWLEVFWRHFGAGGRLRLLAVRRGGEICALVPLAVLEERYRVGRLRVLTWPLREWGPIYGPIGPEPDAALDAALNWALDAERDWDLLELRCLPEDLPLAEDLARRGVRRQSWSEVPHVDLEQGWNDYLQSRSRHFRKNLRRAERRLADLGKVEFVRYRPGGQLGHETDPRWDLYEQCEAVAARSWQARVTNGNTLTHPEVRTFLREAHAAAIGAGAVDLNLLSVGGEPAAFAYNYVWQGRVSGLRMGFDPAVARHGTGTVLLARLIEDSFQRGDTYVDLGAGYLDCKRSWLTRTLATSRWTYYPPLALRAQVVRMKRAAQARWRSWWLDHSGRPLPAPAAVADATD